MKQFIQNLHSRHLESASSFPDKEMANKFIDGFFEFLFIPNQLTKLSEFELLKEYEKYKTYLSTLVYDVVGTADKTDELVNIFFEKVPFIYDELQKDAAEILKFDPAAESIEEVLVAYPGFYATAVYRFSHQLWIQGIKLIPRLFSECAHSKTGIDIHPGAQIGESFFIDHGTGIVIGETSKIGKRVKIYQGVTLGALSVSKEVAKTKRHPTIEDDVVIIGKNRLYDIDLDIIPRFKGNCYFTYVEFNYIK
jgi:serine O-acetyltransferase